MVEGNVTDGVRGLLRLEGLVVLAVSVLVFRDISGDWMLFGILFLVPDLFMLGYLRGPRVGAIFYNISHSYILPLMLAGIGFSFAPGLLPLALIWTAHIGFDRALGYGMKYGNAFGDTHLGRVGKLQRAQDQATA